MLPTSHATYSMSQTIIVTIFIMLSYCCLSERVMRFSFQFTLYWYTGDKYAMVMTVTIIATTFYQKLIFIELFFLLIRENYLKNQINQIRKFNSKPFRYEVESYRI